MEKVPLLVWLLVPALFAAVMSRPSSLDPDQPEAELLSGPSPGKPASNEKENVTQAKNPGKSEEKLMSDPTDSAIPSTSNSAATDQSSNTVANSTSAQSTSISPAQSLFSAAAPVDPSSSSLVQLAVPEPQAASPASLRSGAVLTAQTEPAASPETTPIDKAKIEDKGSVKLLPTANENRVSIAATSDSLPKSDPNIQQKVAASDSSTSSDQNIQPKVAASPVSESTITASSPLAIGPTSSASNTSGPILSINSTIPASAQSDNKLSPAGIHLKSEHVEKREPDEGNKKALAKSDSKSIVQRAKKELDDYNDWGRTADSEWDESNGTLSGLSFELYPWFDFWKKNNETDKLDKEKASLAGKDSMHNHGYQDISIDEFDPIFQQWETISHIWKTQLSPIMTSSNNL